MTESDDERSFRELYEAQVAIVYRYVWRRLPLVIRDEVDDVVADVFTVAWRRRKSLAVHHERTWLLAVARRVVADHLRSHTRRTRLLARIAVQPVGITPLVNRTASTLVEQALSRLSDRDRELIRLIAWDDLPRHEAAQVMGSSVGVLNTRLHRALRRLERSMREPEYRDLPSQTGYIQGLSGSEQL
jgi:RNA polymerase sigma-70 factor (ECF subfamily)